MFKKTLKIIVGLFIIGNSTFAQWSGSTTTSGAIYRDGYVGLGTTTPVGPLHIVNNTNIRSITLEGNSTGWGSGIIFKNTAIQGKSYGIYASPYGNWHFSDNDAGADRILINSVGNVGVGTSNPTEKLEVQGTVKANSFLTSNLTRSLTDNFVYQGRTFGHYAFSWGTDTWATSPTAWLSAYGGIKLFTQGTLRMAIDMNGNMGIGTDNPGSFKLAVEGKIAARGVKVTTSAFADYVFDSTYQLRPLANVEKYINQNKHLPGIPSAKEVEKEGGFELGAMNVKLLEKIEELTLYVIELKKENEQMKKEIKKIGEKR